MSEFWESNALEGIGVLISLISLIYTIWYGNREFRSSQEPSKSSRPNSDTSSKHRWNKRPIIQFIIRLVSNFALLAIATYIILWASILIVNSFTKNTMEILYWSTSLAALFGIILRFLWTKFIGKSR